MMRKAVAMIMTLALVLACAGAAADDYGKAVISAGYWGRLHLRAEPDSDSESLGLFYTGTEVECRSDPGEKWVEVKIGRVRGYMKSAYLRRGEAADAVFPSFREGVVTAPNRINMRKGPSTEYQFIRTLNNGVIVTIMGETENHWYYIEVDGKKGFVSANLIEVLAPESVG